MEPHILCVVGARPNLIKMAPVIRALTEGPRPVGVRLVHTGQHYDTDMNTQFFEALGIPAPDVNLAVGSASHAVQTAEIMRRFEPVLDEHPPAAVLVVGDVNSTLACALVAAKKGVPVIHVEAGLRSFDRAMPEEINRVLTDQISDVLFTTEKNALDNLLREGVDGSRVHFVGNVMIDTLKLNLEKAVPAEVTLRHHGAPPGWGEAGFAALTLHRPSNVDNADLLGSLLETIAEVSARLPVAFSLHPRTRARIKQFGFDSLLKAPRILTMPPLGYLQMLGMMREAKVFLTDSGGIQEETTALGTPCITLRESTERPITEEEGTNTVVGQRRDRILAAIDDILMSGGKKGRIPQLWDGNASHRIALVLRRWLDEPVAGNVRSTLSSGHV
jgi:UDP-N-acetylglucosamine 2-epimerase (non-hydrolysing)